ncbi:MAG: hypothetical protein GY737_06030 [Desulfobacteraceae bacterium]|nr:hypothetical protein [Desulfobacteraceae bacterium]
MIITSSEQLKALSCKKDPDDSNAMLELPEQVRTPEEDFTFDLYQEHLEEIGFLLSQCKGLFEDMDINWPEINDFEQRLDAHVDAVDVGGPPALEITKLFLSDDDEDNISAAAYTLTSIRNKGHGKNIDIIIRSLIDSYDDNGLFNIHVKALKYGHSPFLKDKLEILLNHERPEIQTTAVEILTYRREGAPEQVAGLLEAPCAKLRATAANFLGLAGYREALPSLERLITGNSSPDWEKQVLASLQLGSRAGLNQARAACRSEATITQNLPLYVALAGDHTDLPLLRSTLAYKKVSHSVIEGLGVMGNVKAIPILIEILKGQDDNLKSRAAYSLELITGAGLTEKQVIEEEAAEENEISPNSEHDDDEDIETLFAPDPVEIEMPATSPGQWIEWWQAAQNRFPPQKRWRRGKVFTLGDCIREMADPGRKYHERQRAYLELIIRSGENLPFEADWFVPKQLEAIRKWEEWLER